MQEVYFSIKTYTPISPLEVKNNYKKMVNGLWYKRINELDSFSDLDIVVDFYVNFYINEEQLKEHQHLSYVLARLSGEKSNISSLLARLKEKAKLFKSLIEEYVNRIEEQYVEEERSNTYQENEKTKEKYNEINHKYQTNKVKLKDTTERMNILYKKLKDNLSNEEFELQLSNLRLEQTNLLINENQYKIDLEILKEELLLFSKLMKKPITNIDLEKKINKDKEYQNLNRQYIDIVNTIEYIEQLDSSQNEKSLVVRGIKSVVQSEWQNDKNTIAF